MKTTQKSAKNIEVNFKVPPFLLSLFLRGQFYSCRQMYQSPVSKDLQSDATSCALVLWKGLFLQCCLCMRQNTCSLG